MRTHRSARILHIFFLVLTTTLLTGCLPSYVYKTPEVALPDRYSLLAAVPDSTGETAQWWRMFKDPTLNAIVNRALAENLQIAEAQARVQETQHLAKRAGNTISGNGTLDVQSSGGSESASLGLNLSLDPFGGRNSQARAALQRLEASRYELQGAKLTIIGELLQSYVDLRYFQQTLHYRNLDLQSRRKSLIATNELFEQGAATKLEQVKFRALLAEIQADIPRLEANITQQKSRIATLLGTTLGALRTDLSYSGHQPYLSAKAPIGVPADLLRLRPDIRAAERNYAASVSEVTVAQAARYPSLNLSGQISAPLDGGGTTNLVGAGLVLPLFNQPGLAAQVDVNIARASQAYLQWRSLVLSAVGDVETTLATVESSRRVVNAARRSLTLNLEALRLSKELYNDGGLVTVVDLLDSERAVTNARTEVAEALRTYAGDIISLYLALGVGVEDEPSPGLLH